MKRFLAAVGILVCAGLFAGTAMAESIQKRIGATGRIGFIVPADNDVSDLRVNTDVGFIGGGGLIYGYNNNIALEFDVTYSTFDSERPSGVDMGQFGLLDLALGAQYRFVDRFGKITPYVGAGLDILLPDYDGGKIDTVVGIHFSGGADYFINRNLAVTAELKVVVGPEADIMQGGVKTGNFDTTNFSGTLGVRYFFW